MTLYSKKTMRFFGAGVFGALLILVAPWYVVILAAFPLALISHAIVLIPLGIFFDLLYGSPFIIPPYGTMFGILAYLTDVFIRPRVSVW